MRSKKEGEVLPELGRAWSTEAENQSHCQYHGRVQGQISGHSDEEEWEQSAAQAEERDLNVHLPSA